MLGTKDDTLYARQDPVIGWRAWDVAVEGSELPSGEMVMQPTFASPTLRCEWPSGELTWEGCKCLEQLEIARESGEYCDEYIDDLMQPHQIEKNCHCGINAFASEQLLLDSHYSCQSATKNFVPFAIGQVALSGEVRVYQQGYRAERGEIVKVWAAHPVYAADVQAAAKEHGVEYAGVVERLRSVPWYGWAGFAAMSMVVALQLLLAWQMPGDIAVGVSMLLIALLLAGGYRFTHWVNRKKLLSAWQCLMFCSLLALGLATVTASWIDLSSYPLVAAVARLL